MKRVLVFYPENPATPIHGSHRRCVAVLTAMRELGWAVHLTGSRFADHVPWDAASEARLARELGVSTAVYAPGSFDRNWRRWLRRWHRLSRRPVALDSSIETPPGMRRWFRRQVEAFEPDVLLMNYCAWDGLVDHHALRSIRRVVDTHDLVSLNRAMQAVLRPAFGRDGHPRPDREADVLDERLFDRLALRPAPEEFELYDAYDCTIAISAGEARAIRAGTRATDVRHIPITFPTAPLRNRHTGPALLAIGANVFNLQAYWYFVRRVLPDVRAAAPDFLLQVTGRSPAARPLPETACVVHSGTLPDLLPVYETARFAICPLLAGTGQKVKIVEAMAAGVPVVALRAGSGETPIVDGENGFLVETAREFARRTVELWRDPALCRRLGVRARETIASTLSHEAFVADVRDALSAPAGAARTDPREQVRVVAGGA
jgi:glycosyltransferase involved in cell wall biosynthesis